MPTTPKGQRTDTAFVAAARTVFAEKGYFNTKIADIAAAAGRSTGSFYNYYANKEELLDKLTEQFLDEILSQITLRRHPGDPMQNIEEAVRAYWNAYRDYLPEMIGIFQLSMTDARFAARWHDIRAHGINGVLQGLRAAKRDGAATDIDLDATASALVSMFNGYCWTWLAADGDAVPNPPDDERSIRALAIIWYRTIYGESPAAAAISAPAVKVGSAGASKTQRAKSTRSSRPTAAKTAAPARKPKA